MYVCLRTRVDGPVCARFYVYTRGCGGGWAGGWGPGWYGEGVTQGIRSGDTEGSFCARVYPRNRCCNADGVVRIERVREGRADCLFERRNVTCRYPINVTFFPSPSPLRDYVRTYGRSNVVDSLWCFDFFRRSYQEEVTSTKDDCIKSLAEGFFILRYHDFE